MSKNIRALWIDDDPSQPFINHAAKEEYGIGIVVKECYEDGIAWLKQNRDKCDAVILDVNCKISNDPNESPSMDSFRDKANSVYSICEEGDSFIPWYIYTGGGYEGMKYIESIVPKRDWARKRYYNKPSDRNILLTDIVEMTSEREDVQIRKKYSDIIRFCPDEYADVIIKVAEIIEENKTAEKSVFNEMRGVLGWTMQYGKEHGLFPEPIKSIASCNSFLKQLDDDIIPAYIQTKYNACVESTQNGSHDSSEGERLKVRKDVLEGNAPYLIRSTFFELLDVLTWFQTLPTDNIGIQNLYDKIKEKKVPLDDVYGILQKIDERTYICKDEGTGLVCEVSGKNMDESRIGKRVKLTHVQANRNKSAERPYECFCDNRNMTLA